MGGNAGNLKTTTKSHTTLSALNIHLIHDYFQSNGLHINQKDALKRHPEILKRAEAIVGRDRKLVMDDESWDRLEGTIEEYKDFNELTFLVNVWQELVPTARKTDQSHHMTIGEITDIENPAVWTERAWKDDFLCVTWSADFARELVNTLIKPTDSTVNKILNISPRLKTPRPDLTFGFKKGAFSQDQYDIALHIHTNVQIGLVHPFFALEAKNVSGTIEEAEIQCCRAGAAMVYARRQFIANATTDVEGPDADQSFVFTLALIPTVATLYVHWAEVDSDKGKVHYHQNRVDSYFLIKRREVDSLRQAIYNILDWGLFPLKKEILDTCTKFIDFQQQQDGPPSNDKVLLAC